MTRRGPSASEAEHQAAVTEALTLGGWLWHHNADSRRATPGLPDILAVRGGRLLAWELKTEKGRVRPEQQRWIEALAEVPGVEARIVRPDSLDDLLPGVIRR